MAVKVSFANDSEASSGVTTDLSLAVAVRARGDGCGGVGSVGRAVGRPRRPSVDVDVGVLVAVDVGVLVAVDVAVGRVVLVVFVDFVVDGLEVVGLLVSVDVEVDVEVDVVVDDGVEVEVGTLVDVGAEVPVGGSTGRVARVDVGRC